jgi:hypothetical protein
MNLSWLSTSLAQNNAASLPVDTAIPSHLTLINLFLFFTTFQRFIRKSDCHALNTEKMDEVLQMATLAAAAALSTRPQRFRSPYLGFVTDA